MKKRSTWQIGTIGFFWMLLCPKFFILDNEKSLSTLGIMLGAVVVAIILATFILKKALGSQVQVSRKGWIKFYWILLLFSLVALVAVFLTPISWKFWVIAFLWIIELIALIHVFRNKKV